MRSRMIALALLAGFQNAPLGAEPMVLRPAGPWNLDVDEGRCRLNRLFGEEANQHLLAFEQYAPGTTAGMFVAGPALKPFYSGKPIELRLFAGQPPLLSAPFTGTVEAFGPALIYMSLRFDGETPSTNDASEPEEGGIPRLGPPPAQGRSITVAQGKVAVTFETGPLGSALAALNTCSEDLIFSWGLDLEAHRSATARVRLLNGRQVSNAMLDNFPRELARSDQHAIVRLRVIVSAEGRVEDCLVLGVASQTKFTGTACRVMARAKFEPARDAQGQPMRSYFGTTVTYEGAPNR